MSAEGEIRQEYSDVFSIWADFRYGSVKLLLPDDCSEGLLAKSTGAFAELMRAYAAEQAYAGIDLDNEQDCYFGIVLVTFDEAEDCLRVLSPWVEPNDSTAFIENQRKLERQRRSRIRPNRLSRIEPTVGGSKSEK